MNESQNKPDSPFGGSVPRGEKGCVVIQLRSECATTHTLEKTAVSTSESKTDPIPMPIHEKTSMGIHTAKSSPKFNVFSVFSHMLIYSLMTALDFPSSPA